MEPRTVMAEEAAQAHTGIRQVDTGVGRSGAFHFSREEWWWWVLASVGQLGWGISSYRKGFAGDSHLMPFKAFTVASLFVGAAGSASYAALQASGIHKVKDLLEVGANVRSKLGVPPRAQEKKINDA